MLADCLNRSLEQWEITRQQVLLVATDNGANMAKAVGLVQDRHRAEIDLSAEEVEEHEDVEEEEEGVQRFVHLASKMSTQRVTAAGAAAAVQWIRQRENSTRTCLRLQKSQPPAILNKSFIHSFTDEFGVLVVYGTANYTQWQKMCRVDSKPNKSSLRLLLKRFPIFLLY